MKHRVVVTGLGLVTPLGNTVEATWAGLMAGRSGVGPITKFDASDFLVRFACEVKDFDPLDYGEKKEARKMGRVHTLRYRRLGRSACRQRFEDYGRER
jgi:3-oxoacyl-[acyl-carrier-protein] synthase II